MKNMRAAKTVPAKRRLLGRRVPIIVSSFPGGFSPSYPRRGCAGIRFPFSAMVPREESRLSPPL